MWQQDSWLGKTRVTRLDSAGVYVHLYSRTPFLTDHCSYLWRDPAYPSFDQPSSLPHQFEATRVVFLGSPQITSCVNPLDWFQEQCYLSGLDEAPSGMWEDYRGALRDINGDSPFTQSPLKFVKVWLQVAGEQRRLAGRGYHVCVVRVEGQLDVVRRWGHVVDIQTEEDRGDQSTLSHRSPNAWTRWRGRLEGRFERPTLDVGWDCMEYVRREV